MDSYKNALTAVLALVLMLGGAVVLFDDSSMAAEPGEGSAVADEGAGESDVTQSTASKSLEKMFDTGGSLCPVPSIPEGAVYHDKDTTVSDDDVWSGVHVVTDGVTVTVPANGTLVLDENAKLYLLGTVTFCSDGVFSIEMNSGASLFVGNTEIITTADDDVKYDHLVLTSTGRVVFFNEYTPADDAAQDSDAPNMSFTYRVYIDAVSGDMPGLASLNVFRYLGADDETASSAITVPCLPRDAIEVDMTADINACLFDNDLKAKGVSDDNPFWFCQYLEGKNPVIPDVSVSVSLAPMKEVVRVNDENMGSKVSSVLDIGRITVQVEDAADGFRLVTSPVDVKFSDYKNGDTYGYKATYVDAVEHMVVTADIGTDVSVAVSVSGIKAGNESEGELTLFEAGRSEFHVSADVAPLYDSLTKYIEMVLSDITNPDISKLLKMMHENPKFVSSDMFMDLRLDIAMESMELSVKNEAVVGTDTADISADTLRIVCNLSDEAFVIFGSDEICEPGDVFTSMDGMDVKVRTAVNYVESEDGTDSEDTVVSAEIGYLRTSGNVDKYAADGALAFIPKLVFLFVISGGNVNDAQIDVIVNGLIGMIADGVNVSGGISMSDVTAEAESYKGVLTSDDEAEKNTGYVGPDGWYKVCTHDTLSLRARNAAIEFSMDSRPGEAPDADDGAKAAAEDAKESPRGTGLVGLKLTATGLNVKAEAQDDPVFDASGKKCTLMGQEHVELSADSLRLSASFNILDLFAEMEDKEVAGLPSIDPSTMKDIVPPSNPFLNIILDVGAQGLNVVMSSIDNALLEGGAVQCSDSLTTLNAPQLSFRAEFSAFNPSVSFNLTDADFSNETKTSVYTPQEDSNKFDASFSYESLDAEVGSVSVDLRMNPLFTPTDDEGKPLVGQAFVDALHDNGVAIREYMSAVVSNKVSDKELKEMAEGINISGDLVADVSYIVVMTETSDKDETDYGEYDASIDRSVLKAMDPRKMEGAAMTSSLSDMSDMKLDVDFSQSDADVRLTVAEMSSLAQNSAPCEDNDIQVEKSQDELELKDLDAKVTVENDDLLYYAGLVVMHRDLLSAIQYILDPDSASPDEKPSIEDLLELHSLVNEVGNFADGKTAITVQVSLDNFYECSTKSYLFTSDMPFFEEHKEYIADAGDEQLRSVETTHIGTSSPASDKSVRFDLSYASKPASGEIVMPDRYAFSAKIAADEDADLSYEFRISKFDDLTYEEDVIHYYLGDYTSVDLSTTGPQASAELQIPSAAKDTTEDEQLESTKFVFGTELRDLFVGIGWYGEGQNNVSFDMNDIKASYNGNFLAKDGFVHDGNILRSPEGLFSIASMSVRAMGVADGEPESFDLKYGGVRATVSLDDSVLDGPNSKIVPSYAIKADSVTGTVSGSGTELGGDLTCVGPVLSFAKLSDERLSKGYELSGSTVSVVNGESTDHNVHIGIYSESSEIGYKLAMSLLGDLSMEVPTGTIDGTAVPVGTTVNVNDSGRFNSVKVGDRTYTNGETYTVAAGDKAELQTRHAVNMDLGHDSLTSAAYFNEGAVIELSAPEQRTGYTFVGWFDTDGNKFVTEKMGTEDISVVAHWKAIDYNVKYVLNGGTADLPGKTMGCDSEFFLPDAPVKEGYEFTGWMYDSVIYETGDSFVMPAHDVEFTAVWNEVIGTDDVKVEGKDVSITVSSDSVRLTAEAIDKILANGDVKNIRMTIGDKVVNISPESLMRIAGEAGATDKVTLTVSVGSELSSGIELLPQKAQKYQPMSAVVTVDLQCQGATDKLDPVTVSIPFDASGMDQNKLVVVYINDKNGNITELKDCVYENGMLTFTTDHFSTFAVTEKIATEPEPEPEPQPEPEPEPEPEGGSDNNNTTVLIAVGVIVAVLAVLAVVFIIRRRQ